LQGNESGLPGFSFEDCGEVVVGPTGEDCGGDIVSRVEAATILEFGARGDLDDGGHARRAEFAGEAPVAAEPIDLSSERDGALLDAAVAFVEIGDAVEAGGRRRR
jgi:hypothetical protein